MKNNLIFKLFTCNKYQCYLANIMNGNNPFLGCNAFIYRQYHKCRYLNPDYKPLNHIRCCSNGPKHTPLPNLTNFPVFYWPSFIKVVKNIILSKLIIKPHYDRNFSLDEFTKGSKHAVGVVSRYISEGNLKNLENLLSSDVVEEIKVNLPKFSFKQVLELKIDPNDIYFSFPYEIGVILPDASNPKRRIIEITMCYHVLSGYKNLTGSPNFSVELMDYEDKLYVLNYRFFKEFTVGISNGEWTINALNHCKPLVTDLYH